FTADGGTANGGYGLWTTDGTAGGTRQVMNFAPAASAGITSLAVVGSKLIFVAPDATTGPQTWTSDGTAAGTHPLFGTTGFVGYPSEAFNGKRFLISPDQTTGQGRYALWITDGTAAGTVRVPQVLVDGASGVMISLAGLYFVNAADADHEPWISDGTTAG